MHLTKGRKMKKLLVIAVALAAVNAEATNARINALGNSSHLVDTATVYNNPADIFSLGGDYVTFESGATNAAGAQQGLGNTAEGMIVRTMGDAKLGLSLGNRSTALRTTAASAAFGALATPAGLQIGQQNPLELTYGAKAGDMSWAGTLVYSNLNNKVTEAKESTMGVRLGARAGNWDGAVRLGLGDTVQTLADGKYTGTMSLSANGGYWMDSIYWFGNLRTAGYKWENAASVEQAKFTTTAITVGALSSMKKDGTEVFYSAALTNTESKIDDSVATAGSKTTSLTLPLQIGVEAEANSWLTLRGSVSQNLQLLNTTKTSPQSGAAATADLAPGNDNLTFAAGVGMKLNKVTVDASLFQVNGAGTNANITTDNMLANVGMSYWF